ncbi:alpha/beta hydrolase, partial [Mycobacterium manitobense]|nr:alpha/beta hydrolase [[Mycobacterium] manitobense]
MNLLEWRDRPSTVQFGPASWQTRLLNALSAIFVRPVLGVLTVLGLVINRIRPATLQRARLDIIDAPMRVLRPLRGTVVTPTRLPDCPAEWVVAPGSADSD